MQPTENAKKTGLEFEDIKSTTPVQLPQPRRIAHDELVDMTTHSSPFLSSFVAYSQNDHMFDANGQPVRMADKVKYDALPREQKVNKFGKAYKDDARLWLHKDMASVVVKAAEFMKEKYHWTSKLYDGLRTVDGAYNMYLGAAQKDLDDKLLAAPGLSAHNKGMAIDLVMFDINGKLVEMGGNFDHLDMKTNSRNYKEFPQAVIENRIKREIAFQHAALSEGKLFAPLRSEFWDERFPENEADHWRVLESLCRCMGQTLLSDEDQSNLKAEKGTSGRDAFHQKWELMSYDQFKEKWRELFPEATLREKLGLPAGVSLPPDRKTIIYHGDFHPIYDRDLPPEKQLTTNEQQRAAAIPAANSGVYIAPRGGSAAIV